MTQLGGPPRFDWRDAVVLESPPPRSQRRQRLAAGAAFVLAVAGVLAVVGLARVVLAVVALIALAGGARAVARRVRPHWSSILLTAGRVPELLVRTASKAVRRVPELVERLRPAALRAGAEGRVFLLAVFRFAHTGALTAATATVRALVLAHEFAVQAIVLGTAVLEERLRSADPAPRREALRLNTLGSELRRNGDPRLAAEHHRLALAIYRRLRDARAEALTLSNLALALAAAEEDAAAVEAFEQALAILRSLGYAQYEGQVAANLATLHDRCGRAEEAGVWLRVAFEKLPPGSRVYRQVEQRLCRGSRAAEATT